MEKDESGEREVEQSKDNSVPLVTPTQLNQLKELPRELLPKHQEYILKQVQYKYIHVPVQYVCLFVYTFEYHKSIVFFNKNQ